ncbi:hypothetical protein [Methylobacterium soli]|uniref:hypothetical protein n=1 Tax=Methylobacterium soli TaxID=553447 RepID=UPI001782DF7F|nr:hypothetical protein [Methylobacterium soli]
MAMPAVMVPMMTVVPVMPYVAVTTVMGQRHAVGAADYRGRGREVGGGGRFGRCHEESGEQRYAEGQLLHP